MISWLKGLWSKSLTRQLMLGIALVHAFLMSLFVYDLVEREREFLTELNKQQIISLAEVLAINSSSWLLANDLVGLDEIIKAQQSYPNVTFSMVLDTKNKVLAYTDINKVGSYASDEISQQLQQNKSGVSILIESSAALDVAAPIKSADTVIGWARVHVTRENINENLSYVTKRGIIYSFFAIIIGSIFAWFMARGLTASIHHLTDVTQKIEKGVRNLPYQSNRVDEVGELSASLNNTLNYLINNEKEVKKHHDHLEELVQGRTEELSAAYQKIQGYSKKIENDQIELQKTYDDLVHFQEKLVENETFSHLGRLVAGVAHELNTPIGVAVTSHSIVDENITLLHNLVDSNKVTKNELIKTLTRIQEAQKMASESLNRCVELITTFKQIATSNSDGDVMLVQSLDYFKELVRTFDALLRKNNIEFVVQGTNSALEVKTSVLSEIFMNLLLNASANAFVNIKKRKLVITITEQENWLTIGFRDNGVGMSTEIKEHLFEPFFTTKRSKGKTGLGMSIVYNLVTQNLKGNITVESELGCGTEIYIQLPKKSKSQINSLS